MLGYSREELAEMSDPWHSLIHPDDRAGVITMHLEHVKQNSGYYEVEQRLLHRDGHYIWVLSRCRVELDRKGRPVRSSGYQIDITDLKARLLEQGAALTLRNSYVGQAPIHIGVFDRPQKEFVYWSRSDDAEGIWRMVPSDDEGAALLFMLNGQAGEVLPLGPRGEDGSIELYELDDDSDGSLIGVLFKQRSHDSVKLAQAQHLIGSMHSRMSQVRLENRSLESLAMSLQATQTRLEKLSQVDSLTGLWNRRAFEERLEELSESETPFLVALLDIDHFKRINDSLGHPVGDAVLRETGRTLLSVVQPGQEVARIGGEEFAWLMPDVPLDKAILLLEKARSCFEAETWSCGALTISAGLAERLPGEAPQDLVARADRALYEAKRLGRNQVQVDPGTLQIAV
jgi:diguanylate cyclase (GGDEF)-like protein/PAS domain S-box-containing protein